MNIILIDLDTLRADHLGCYGYQRATSPNIDRIARESVVFEQFFAPNIPTHPSHTSMFSGKEAITHNIVSHGGKVEPESVTFLAELLQRNGYRTAAADNLGGWLKRGFDIYRSYRFDKSADGALRKAEDVNAVALPILDELDRSDQPFFVWLHYWDPHTPYLPPPPYSRMFYSGNERDPNRHEIDHIFHDACLGDYFADWMGGVTDPEFVVGEYDAEIAYLDAQLARVFDRIARLRAASETLLILVADHGEVLAEHEGEFNHHGLYDANIRIPLILRGPRLPPGHRVSGLTQNIDLAPTILEMAGLGHLAAEVRMEGRSLLPLIQGDRADNYSEMFFSEATVQCKRAIRTKEWKLIRAAGYCHHNLPRLQLYDLRRDPDEQHNIADEHPDVARALEGRLDAWIGQRLRETGRAQDPVLAQGHSISYVPGGHGMKGDNRLGRPSEARP